MLRRITPLCRLFAAAAFVVVASSAEAYRAEAPHPSTRPHDAALPHGLRLHIPEAGLDFLAEQLRFGLQSSDLKETIVEALEGQYFIIVMPVFGGDFRITVTCGLENSNRNAVLADPNYEPGKATRPWCPYLTHPEDGPVPATIQNQVAVPAAEINARAFRYEKVLADISTFPVDGLATPQPNSLFAALFLVEEGGGRAQLDLMADHPLLYVNFQIPEAFFVQMPGYEDLQDCYSADTEVLSLHMLGEGCRNTFIATLEASLVTGGQLRPYFEKNVLYVLVNDFHTRLSQDLKIITPFTQNPAILQVFNLCDTFGLDCSAQQNQMAEVFGSIELAFGQAALGLFERELNAALSDVLEDGINQLMFDKEKDGVPDPVVGLDDLAVELSKLTGRDFDFNFAARYESAPVAPAEADFILDGGLFATTPDACVNPGKAPAFRYSHLEQDGTLGHDAPQLPPFIPGTTRPYQIGLALSDDLLNQVLYNIWYAGLLCVTISPHDANVPPEVASLLTTKSFAPFARWLADLAPDSPILLQITPRQAPYVSFGDVGDGSFFRITAPSLHVDVYVEMGSGAETRPLRAFGFAVDLTAAVDVGAVNFDRKPLIDLSVRFDTASQVIFNDLAPEENDALAALIPGVLGLMAPELAIAIGDLEIPGLTDCVGGLQQRDLVLGSSGNDPESGIDNYLNLYLNFDGYLDFERLISKCLFAGAPPPMTPRVDLGLHAVNDVTVNPASLGLVGDQPYRWRLNGGFWSMPQAGLWSATIPLDGSHRLDFEQDGVISSAALRVDGSAPIIRTRQDKNRFTIEAFDVNPVFLRIDGGNWIAAAAETIVLRPGRHRLHIVARDAAGHESALTANVNVAAAKAGCATGSVLHPAVWVLLALWLRRRRS